MLARPTRWTLLSLGAAVALAFPAGASGASIPVTIKGDTVANDGQCSLREAITAANADAATLGCPAGNGADTITLGAGTFALSREGARENVNATGDLDVVAGSVLTISGAGASSTIIDAKAIPGEHDRVLDIKTGATATVRGVTLTGGHAPDGGKGADVTGSGGGGSGTGGAGGDGSGGGGIANLGTLTVASSRIFDNVSGKGGAGGQGTGGLGDSGLKGGPGYGGQGGAAGLGGGIYSEGPLTVTNTAVASNRTGPGGAGGNSLGGDGGTAGVGPSGDGGDAGGFLIAIGRGGGNGGGIYSQGTLTVTSSTIADNVTGKGGAGGTGVGGAGGGGNQPGDGGNGEGGIGGYGGRGGGIYSEGGLTLAASTLARNVTGTGGAGGSGFGFKTGIGGDAGGGGQGGGMAVTSGTHTGTNTTVVGNHTGDGARGGNAGGQTATAGGGGDGGDGGGLFSTAGNLSLVHTTIASNEIGAGGDGGATDINSGPKGSPGSGRAVNVQGGTTALANTIAKGDCFGSIADFGRNLATVPLFSSCPGTLGDPKLGPLQDNGGPTQTMALGAGSDAIDKIPASGAGCTPKDQRGGLRPAGPLCDIGAFEAGAVFPSEAIPAGAGKTTLPGAVSDHTAPTGQVTVDPETFAVGAQATPITTTSRRTVAKGTTIGYRLSEAASVVLSIQQKTRGLKLRRGKAKPRCVAATPRNRRSLVKQLKRALGQRALGPAGRRRLARRLRRSSCVLYAVRGTLRRQGSSGSNRLPFSGRIGSKALRAGRYRIVLVATDTAGNRSNPAQDGFRIVRSKRKAR